jgi:hypothetical protein|tara:strand:- start:3837 stop:4301 length:465 start_codon:yes stop_codon:yes gene_type:complete
MGADFALVCCEDPMDYAKALPIVLYRIETISDNILDNIAEDYLWSKSEDVKDEFDDSGLEESDLWKLNDLIACKIRLMVRQELVNEVTSLIGEGNVFLRDIAHITLQDTSYMFSGGMTWGDCPTESYDTLCLIDAAGLFNGMGKEDFDYDSFKC